MATDIRCAQNASVARWAGVQRGDNCACALSREAKQVERLETQATEPTERVCESLSSP